MTDAPRQLPDNVIWWPLALGGGIGAFFALPFDPAWLAGCLALGLFLPLAIWAPWRFRAAAVLLVLAMLGFTLAQLRTYEMAAPIWAGKDKAVSLTAVVEESTPMPVGVRLLLRDVRVEQPAVSFAKIRLLCKACGADEAPVGARVSLRGSLSAPAGPAREGGFDFRRIAFYRQIGAVGFVFGHPSVIAPPADVNTDFFAGARQRLAAQIDAHIGNKDTKALAIALLTGVSTALPEDLRAAYQMSGLAHIYSVSGLHLGFVAGFLFFLFRGAFALFPSLVLRYPVKKIAAFMALMAVILFTLFAGDSVPTWRSLLMTALVLLGVMTDRFAFTLRAVALAACVILALMPEMLLDVSFQLSFAAVTALVAWMEWVERIHRKAPPTGLLSRPANILREALVTTLLATLATLPFILHSFGRLPTWSVVANLVGIPFTGFVIMPLVLLVLVAFLFGLAPVALTLLAPTLLGLNEWAYAVAGWPGADLRVAVTGAWPLLACALALYVACVHPRRWTVGVLLIAYLWLGVEAFRPSPKPDAYVSDNGLVAVVNNGTMWVSSTTKAKFVRNQWLGEWGLPDTAVKALPKEGVAGDSGQCSRAACVLKTDRGMTVYLVRSPLALPELCGEAAKTSGVLVAPDMRVSDASCPKALSVIDKTDLRRNGVHILRDGNLHPLMDAAQNRLWSGNDRKFY